MSYSIETITPETVTMELCNKLGDLQGEIWGLSGLDKYPPWATLIIVMSGNFLTVAFDGEEPVGFALLQRSQNVETKEPYLYLSMIGIHPNYRNQGIGESLIKEVKAASLENDYHSIKWTYDPLEPANANLYIRKLGARVHKYYVNYYGELSGTNQGGETDRFWAELDLNSSPRSETKATVVVPLDQLHSFRISNDSPNSVAVEIPDNFARLKSESPQRAEKIRLSTRHVFQNLFKSGYEVQSFYRDGSQNYYVCGNRG
jgi:predicted GNAT superfamily acetyltransferase